MDLNQIREDYKAVASDMRIITRFFGALGRVNEDFSQKLSRLHEFFEGDFPKLEGERARLEQRNEEMRQQHSTGKAALTEELDQLRETLSAQREEEIARIVSETEAPLQERIEAIQTTYAQREEEELTRINDLNRQVAAAQVRHDKIMADLAKAEEEARSRLATITDKLKELQAL